MRITDIFIFHIVNKPNMVSSESCSVPALIDTTIKDLRYGQFLASLRN